MTKHSTCIGHINGVTVCFNIENIKNSPGWDSLPELLLDVAKKAGLTPVKHTLKVVAFPIIDSNGRGTGEHGFSGGVILLESHVYIHTWNEINFARLEISSCKGEIDSVSVEETIKQFLGQGIKISKKEVMWS